MTANITAADDLCKICDGKVECAPTAILLISLVHTLYGYIGPEPDYFSDNKEKLISEQNKKMNNIDEFTKDNDDKENLPRRFRKTSGSKKVHRSSDGEEDKVEKTPVPFEENSENNFEEDNSEEYDFIIVGGGTAGCVIASRLSENRKWKILLVEAGPEEPKIALIPSLTSEFRGSSLDWQYSMRPKIGFCEDRGSQGCEVVQGRVLGGTSVINDLAYIRGNAADYDEWAVNGNDGWGYYEVLRYFKYSEGNYDIDVYKNTPYHSTKGPLDVGRYPYVDENVDVLLSALSEAGYNYTDVNSKNQLGFMRIQTMSYHGERVSTYTAFIEPIRKVRARLEIITEALVTKVLFEKIDNLYTPYRATGIEFIKHGKRNRVNAIKEIIICAGTINTAKLIMQSGIGPKAYLEYLGIKVYRDAPVGSNFHDHLSVCLPVITLSKTSTMKKFPEKLKDITDYYAKGTGPLSANFQVIAFLESKMSEIIGTPDLEIRFKGHDSNMYYDSIDVCVSLLTPKSRGHIVLNASDPVFGKPLIYPNYLKHPRDEKILLEGLQETVKLFDTDVFKAAEFEFDPRPLLNNECKDYRSVSNEFWLCVIKYFSSPLHNYVGTCKMGPSTDGDSIVDQNLKVHGISNIRIADASIIPKITRGSTAAAVIMIAEKASDAIKTTWY